MKPTDVELVMRAVSREAAIDLLRMALDSLEKGNVSDWVDDKDKGMYCFDFLGTIIKDKNNGDQNKA